MREYKFHYKFIVNIFIFLVLYRDTKSANTNHALATIF